MRGTRGEKKGLMTDMNELTPEEVEGARREFEELKHNINAERARAGSRIIFP